MLRPSSPLRSLPALLHHFKRPVMITDGHMQYLYDETGRRYLDVRERERRERRRAGGVGEAQPWGPPPSFVFWGGWLGGVGEARGDGRRKQGSRACGRKQNAPPFLTSLFPPGLCRHRHRVRGPLPPARAGRHPETAGKRGAWGRGGFCVRVMIPVPPSFSLFPHTGPPPAHHHHLPAPRGRPLRARPGGPPPPGPRLHLLCQLGDGGQ